MNRHYALYDQLATYLNREGDTRVAKEIDIEWKRRIIQRHRRFRREINKLETGEVDYASVYKQYGTTLLGLMISNDFVFGFQLGDGDVCYVNEDGLEKVLNRKRFLASRLTL